MGEADKAYERALGYLERSSRTEREVGDRLARYGFSEGAVAEALGRLRDAGLVDDDDYAERYMEALAAKGRGRLRIAADMRRKGLPDALIRNMIEDGCSDVDERARAMDAARRAFAGIPDGTDARKAAAKVNRRLVSLGFSYGVIGEVMNEIRRMDDGAGAGE